LEKADAGANTQSAIVVPAAPINKVAPASPPAAPPTNKVTPPAAPKQPAQPPVAHPETTAKTEPPKAEPKAEPKVEPKAEPKVETPKPETPKAEPPKAGGQGTLLLGSKPPCDIFIDGQSTGMHTPQKDIKLPSGKHKITLVNNEFGIKETFT